MAQLPDPDDVLRRAGLSRAELRRLETDDEVIQCRDKRVEAVIATPWRIEPNQTRSGKFLTAVLSPHIDQAIAAAMNAVFYGYSVSEVLYERRQDGRIGISEISEKPFEWFAPRADGSVRFFPDDGSGGYEGLETDPRKYLLTVSKGSYRNPYGEAIYSRLWWPVFFRTQGWKFWAQFLERFGTPMLLGKTQGNANDLATAIAAAVQDAVLVAGQGDEIQAVEVGKDGQQFSLFESALVSRIQKVILGQTLTSQIGSSGSYAAAKVHQDVQQEKRNADLRMVTRTLQRLVDSLCGLNGLPSHTLVMADNTGLEMERAQRDALLVEKGILKLTQAYLMDRYDFREEDFEMPEPPEPPPIAQPRQQPADNEEPAGPIAQPKAEMMAFAAHGNIFTPEQMAVERLADEALAKSRQPIEEQAIRSAVLGASSPEDLEARLATVLREADTSEFRRQLERGLFAADLMGYAHAGGR